MISVKGFSILQIIFCCASIISHMIVKLTINRNNILKKNPIYVYILSILFNNTVYLLWNLILLANPGAFSATSAFLHVPLQIVMIFYVGNILTLIAFTLKYPVRRDNYMRFLMGIWIIIIVFIIIFTITYFAFEFYIYPLFTVVTFIAFLILLVLHVACRVIYRKERGDYALQLNFVSVYVVCNVLYQFWWFISYNEAYSDAFNVILGYVALYASIYGVVNAISLLFFDRKYKICCLETVKCSKTKYFDTHENDIPDETLLSTHNPS